ncbi:MAG: hypothetical protein AAGF24_13570, partial [Cyanobacteria bacterium P01_H01_bin.121]
LPRTGSRSLAAAFETLGYNVWHGGIEGLSQVPDLFQHYNVLIGLPGAVKLEAIPEQITLINTVRDLEEWLDDYEFGPRLELSDRQQLQRQRLFGQVEFDREVWRQAYERYQELMETIVISRQVFSFNVYAREGWAELYTITGRQVPFPTVY